MTTSTKLRPNADGLFDLKDFTGPDISGYLVSKDQEGRIVLQPLVNAAQTFDFEDGNGPVPARRHTNQNGALGGWVAETAKVAPTCYVGENARVYGKARVFGSASVCGHAKVYGNAWVSGHTQVSGHAQVHGDASVFNDWVYGSQILT